MAIENTYLLGKNITLGCGFDLQAKAPLDSRQTVPAFAGLQALIDNNAAYEGMIVYDEETKKTYQAQIVDDVLKFREFGINEAELKDLIASETTAAMEFKGAATALPENPAKGDMYKVTVAFKVDDEDVKVGDSIVYDGEQWFIIPSGDDIEDTWRPVTGVDNDSTLTFVAGDKLEKTVAADGTITYKHAAIDAPVNQNSDEDEPTRTYITQLITDNHGHVIGFKTATEVVEDTNTIYEFEGQSDEATSVYFQVKSSDAEAAEVVYLDAYSKNEADAELAKKVDVEIYNAYIDGKSMSDEELKQYAKDYADGLADNYAEAEHDHVVADITDFESVVEARITAKGYATTGEVAEAKSGAEAKAAELDAALKSELQAEIDADVKVVADDLAGYKASNNEALASVKATADAAAVKTEVEAALAGKVDAEAYAADKATFAIAETVNAALDLKANAADVVANDTFEEFKTANTQAIADARTGAVEDVSKVGYALANEVAETYATKTELGNVDKKFENYVTSASYAEDKAAIEKSIEDEAKALAEVDAGFETRIANLEANFGDGEGTVEAQIAAAVKAEEDARKEAVKGVQDAVDAVEGRMDTAEGKIADLEAASATHATKDELNGVDAKFAQYVTSAFYAEDKAGIDEAISDHADAIAAEAERAAGIEDGLRTDVDAIKADYLKAADKTALQEQITANANAIAVITDGVDADKIDGLKDLISWADEHAPEVKSIKEDIEANAKAIADQATSDAATYETKTDASAKLAEAKSYADGVVATEKAAREATDAELASAIETAKTEAANQDAVVLSEAQKYADAAKAEAVADAASKYETKGTAQGIVDALKLGETYEPIGAETRAIAAAKGETEKQVGDLAKTLYTKDEVDALLAATHTWGEF